MAVSKVGTPKYIKYLLSPDTPLDFHINVGDPDEMTPERIGAVKWMLIARSNVFRVMLLEGELKEKSGFPIKDVDPKTFKNFLTYMYGHDNTSSLPFEDSIKLLKAADQFDVEDLKDTMSNQIREQVSTENVFTVLQYPQVCEQVAPLWEKTTEIIQYQTEDVFGNDQFVDLSLQAMQFILQQDCLSVTEIDIWRAALRWAKHKGQLQDESTNPKILRELVLPLLKHIRLCTLTLENFHFEVLITNILTSEEIKYICLSVKHQQKIENLTSINNKIEKRDIVSNIQTYVNAGEPYLYPSNFTSTFWILTLTSNIELLSIMCEAKPQPQSNKQFMTPSIAPETTYQCECEVKILRITDYTNNTSTEPPVTVSFREQVRYGEDFEIPVRQDNRAVLLQPNNKYAVELSFTLEQIGYFCEETNSKGHDITTDFEISYANPVYNNQNWAPSSHMKKFKYRVSTGTCQQPI